MSDGPDDSQSNRYARRSAGGRFTKASQSVEGKKDKQKARRDVPTE